MSSTSGVNQAELKKLLKSMKKLPIRVQKNIMNGATRSASVVVTKEVKSRVPYELGFLDDAIVTKKIRVKPAGRAVWTKYKTYVKIITLENGSKLKNTRQYGRYLEYGTEKMASQPFFRPSLYAVGSRPLNAARAYFAPAFARQKKKLGFK